MRVTGAPLAGDDVVDVVIVGAGFTGLWTAHSLAVADPSLRIAVVERDVVGFGASGRNGGWCSALLPMSLTTIAARHGRDAAIRLQRAMNDTIVEVGRVLARRDIDAEYVKGGTVTLARTSAQLARLDAEIAELRAFGFGDADIRRLGAADAAARCRGTGVLGGAFTPHCAAVHPARLVHGLARAVLDLGVRIHEHTAVVDVQPGDVTTEHGHVRAAVIVVATEAYGCELPGRRRDLIPLYSLMVATDPLPAAVWDEIGLAGRPTFHDGRRMIIYGQRTADGRLAFGGRGAPYHYGSRITASFDTDPRVRDALTRTARDLFPVLAGVSFPYHWGGPLGVPRDWHCAVRYDRQTGIGFAGGYVGDGVATTNLAGRVLADLITGRESDLVDLPIVDHRSRRWEPEPLRWIGINLARTAAGRADAAEAGRGRWAAWSSRAWGSVVDRLTGG
jgi:glycine/D-amino acid oxidase-like deaminating enzyme